MNQQPDARPLASPSVPNPIPEEVGLPVISRISSESPLEPTQIESAEAIEHHAASEDAVEELISSSSDNNRAVTATQIVNVETHGEGPPAQFDANGDQRAVDREDRLKDTPSKARIRIDRLGDFLLQKKLGEGAMGIVYQAWQESLDRVVAIKVLAKHLSNDPIFVQRLVREARAMAKLDHPHILHCYAVGETRGCHYLAMEYADGGSLETWLNKFGNLTVGDALHIIMAAADGLQHAHEQDLIHRDVKPDNLLITSRGVVKVADLGLAKGASDDLTLTRTGMGAGTPVYMAPEQARNAKSVDGRADIYALGGVLYRCLTGQAPFQGETYIELFEAKEKNQFTRASKFNDDVPKRLDFMIGKMLAKDPRFRYQTCADLLDDLASLELANPGLSFVSSATVSASAVRKSSGAWRSQASAAAVSALLPVTPASEPEPEWWYIKAMNFDGIRKMNRKQVLELIQDVHFDWKAEASRSREGEFRALGTFREFEGAVKGRVAKGHADRKTATFKSKFKEILKEEEEEYHRDRELSTLVRRWGSWIILIVIVAVLGIGGYFGYLALKPASTNLVK